jgi:hypothetical protein
MIRKLRKADLARTMMEGGGVQEVERMHEGAGPTREWRKG